MRQLRDYRCACGRPIGWFRAKFLAGVCRLCWSWPVTKEEAEAEREADRKRVEAEEEERRRAAEKEAKK